MRKFALVATVAMTLTLVAGCTSSSTPAKAKTAAAESTVPTTIYPSGGDRTTTTIPSVTVATAAQGGDPRLTPTAIAGADGYLWLLGTYPCASRTCLAVMRSSDAGKTFTRVAAPSVSLPGKDWGGFESLGSDQFVFANAEDGYLYLSSPTTRLYWTKDGGKVWQLAGVTGPLASPIVTTEGRAYALVSENCSNGYCQSLTLTSSAVTANDWTTMRLSVAASMDSPALAAFGSNVWLIQLPDGGGYARLRVSHDAGHRFSPLSSRGMAGLYCDATATSSVTLWGFCSTGLQGYAARSTDGGHDFEKLPQGSSNAGRIYPVSNDEAIFQVATYPLLLTSDSGEHFEPMLRSPQDLADFDVALASRTTWLVLGISPTRGNTALWRTSNGGRSWQSVKVPTV